MNEPFNEFTLPIFGINFLFHSLMIEKALLVYRRRLDQKKKKQNNALHKNTNSKMRKKKKTEKKKNGKRVGFYKNCKRQPSG